MQKKDVAMVAWLVGFAMGSALWIFVCVSSSRAAAINAGVAEYIIDKTTGQVKFQYIAPCKTP